jgi:hypothetical protein
MAKFLDGRILTVGLVMITAGLLGQFAAQGISPQQWLAGLTAVAGSIGLAVLIRVWPAPVAADDRAKTEA